MKKIMTRNKGLQVALMPWMFALAGTAHAQLTISGADIVNTSCGIFSNGTPTVVDDSFQITDSFGTNSLVYHVEIIPPGSLATGTDVDLNFVIEMTRISSDNDSLWGVADGGLTDRVSYFAFDGNTHAISYGPFGTGSGEFDTTSNFQALGSCSGSCGSSVGSDYTVELTFTQVGNGNASLEQTTTEGANMATTSFDFPQGFDVADGLTLVLARQSSSEEYQINSITFDPAANCEGSRPAPAEPVPVGSTWSQALLITMICLLALTVLRRRRSV